MFEKFSKNYNITVDSPNTATVNRNVGEIVKNPKIDNQSLF